MIILITPDVKSYYKQNVLIPQAKFERLHRRERQDGKITFVYYFLTKTSANPTKSLAERFCCCCTCCDADPENSPKKMLKKDLDEEQKPLHKWQGAVKKMIRLLDLGKKGSLPLKEDYWCELIHPNHFASLISFPLFNTWKKTYTKIISFENWLKTSSGQADTESLFTQFRPKEYKMELISKKEKQRYLAHLDTKDSRAPFLLQPNELPFIGSLIYVITPDKKIYVGTKKRNSFHHSSFVKGGSLISAGCIETDPSGKIKQINSYSGHYAPQAHDFFAAINIFREQGLIIDENDISNSGERGPVIYTWKNPDFKDPENPLQIV